MCVRCTLVRACDGSHVRVCVSVCVRVCMRLRVRASAYMCMNYDYYIILYYIILYYIIIYAGAVCAYVGVRSCVLTCMRT